MSASILMKERKFFSMLGYLGPDGTFSHQAASAVLLEDEELVQYSNLFDVIHAVDNGDIERGIVPIENSIEGSVNATLDTLAIDADVYITGEYILEIRENIMVKKGARKEDIKIITSHPQPIGQCSKILNAEFSDVTIEYEASTAKAALRTANSDGSVACVGAKTSAEVYGLDILFEDCANENNNCTRFVIIEKKPASVVSSCDKTSIAFTLNNRPGALYEALGLLAESNINMLKIESRPLKNELGKYIFLIDVEGNIDDATIYFALDKIKRHTDFYKFLGSYSVIRG